ncbi:glycosyltransferase family 2 protein [Haloarcula rubripromontorii]|uniref:glycosyltransferase family 2 protein n=1 Tax=Haloarcula rubripromontorii TaxID=1705562 RepID=UPI00345BC84E
MPKTAGCEPTVFGLILNWNNAQETTEAAKSLLDDGRTDQIVIIDNGSTDDSVSRLRKEFANYSSIEFILNDENVGFAAGMNVGIRHSIKNGATHVLLLNDDAEITDSSLNTMLQAFDEHNKVGIVGPRICYYQDKSDVWHGGGRINMLTGSVDNPERDKSVDNLSKDSRNVGFVTGCVMLLSAEMIKDIGLLDQSMTFYYEDMDICHRAIAEGYKIRFVPEAVAYHKISPSPAARVSAFAMYHLAKSRLIFISKFHSSAYLLYGLLLQVLVFTPYRLSQIMCSNGDIRAFFCWLQGTYDGAIAGMKRQCGYGNEQR